MRWERGDLRRLSPFQFRGLLSSALVTAISIQRRDPANLGKKFPFLCLMNMR